MQFDPMNDRHWHDAYRALRDAHAADRRDARCRAQPLKDFRRWSNEIIDSLTGSNRTETPRDALTNMGELLRYLRTVSGCFAPTSCIHAQDDRTRSTCRGRLVRACNRGIEQHIHAAARRIQIPAVNLPRSRMLMRYGTSIIRKARNLSRPQPSAFDCGEVSPPNRIDPSGRSIDRLAPVMRWY